MLTRSRAKLSASFAEKSLSDNHLIVFKQYFFFMFIFFSVFVIFFCWIISRNTKVDSLSPKVVTYL
ncbi:MAG: hypothetical protein CVT98_05835 [Bacteroidetes bacterium HGW-Bacteroidetes-15]|nr:MAG: hypothetical protein CVT98_05835 [Bacteroidetes bacterium HGW-Bacteroidetes-15]